MAAGEKLVLPFKANAWAIKHSDGPAGFYLVYQDQSIIPITQVDIGPFETAAQTSRMAGDRVPVPTPALIYAQNDGLSRLNGPSFSPITPAPISFEMGNGRIELTSDWGIDAVGGLEHEAVYALTMLGDVLKAASDMELTTGQSPRPGMITLRLGAVEEIANHTVHHAEAYRLDISLERGIVITGATPAGVFYGLQSLRSLIDPEAYQHSADLIVLPAVSMADAPRFAYRGMHLDVARNFQSKSSVERLLELMAFYKLNKFHFHLTDDEGWRLEIPDLPELTEVGARRGHTLDESDRLFPSLGSGPFPDEHPGSGYYTAEEFVDILRFAKERHIEVIPEIDVPGHARAAIVAMKARYRRLLQAGEEAPDALLLSDENDASVYQSVQMWNDNVIDVCLPSTYVFLEKVIDELVVLFRRADMPLRIVHTGGDEVPTGVWTASPACATLGEEDLHTYFLSRFHEILEKHNIRLGGWEEIALRKEQRNGVTTRFPHPAFADRSFIPYVWDNVWGWGSEHLGYELANAGYDVVFSNATNLYFDLAYDKHPEEPGYYWAGFVDTFDSFSFMPLDLYKNASEGLMGQPIDRTTTFGTRTRLSVRGREHVLGIQGQLWAENARSQEAMEYLVFPKLLGLAERAWSPQPAWARVENDEQRAQGLQSAWNEFANRLGQRELPRLDARFGGIGYRLPPPGLLVRDGEVLANVAFPGVEIRYSTSGIPTSESPVYTGPVPYDSALVFVTMDRNGRASRPVKPA